MKFFRVGGADRFIPVNYQKDWTVVRQVGENSEEKFDRTAYEKSISRKK